KIVQSAPISSLHFFYSLQKKERSEALTPLQPMPLARFIIIFLILLAIFEFALLIDVVDRDVIIPFTSSIATVSGAIIRAVPPGTHVVGTTISAPCFAVDIRN